jgi:hypothetical protein
VIKGNPIKSWLNFESIFIWGIGRKPFLKGIFTYIYRIHVTWHEYGKFEKIQFEYFFLAIPRHIFSKVDVIKSVKFQVVRIY